MKDPRLKFVILLLMLLCSFPVFCQNENKTSFLDKAPNAKSDSNPSDDLFDLIFEYPCAVGGGEAGIECDETYIYTTKWNGDQFYRYDLTGTLVDSFSISGISMVRDLAWNGTYFYGGAASTTVYELDFDNELLVGTFTAPTQVRAIAYDEDNNTFYANNWGTDITQFNVSGSNLGSFPVGPFGDSYYGFAYEDKTGNPFLWGYAQVGATQNEVIQLALPSGVETGLSFDLGNVLNISSGIAGGLCASDVCYDFALIGMSQNEYIWALEITTAGCCQDNDIGVWSIVEPTSGGGFSNSEPVTINIYNNGWNPQSNFAVYFTHNGSEPYYDTISTILNFSETITFTFDTTIDLSMGGIHYIEASTHLVNDECIINDTKTKTIFGPPLPGSLEGFVTSASTAAPIEGALIEVGSYNTTSGADGYYEIEDITPGTYLVYCIKDGYNPISDSITIAGNDTIQIDFSMTSPTMEIQPEFITVYLMPNDEYTDTISILNNGTGPLNWTASVEYLTDDSDDIWDLIFQIPVGVGGGEAGIETDGNHIYTTMWTGSGEFQKYNMEGIWLETITVTGANGIRDMAFDGSFFYGGAASTTVFQMDLANAALISSFTAPTNIRAIAFNEDDNVFYANNWDSDIFSFDATGTSQGSFSTGPIGNSYYGFAYDNYSDPGNPKLWGYAQNGATQNELIEMDLSTGLETGLSFDVGSVASVGTGIAGGLAIDDHISPGVWAFLGTSQNVILWAIELSPNFQWCQVEPINGTIAAGESSQCYVHFTAPYPIPPNTKTANIHFYADPNVGSVVVPVEMWVSVPGLGYIAGTVTLDGAAPYNSGDVSETYIYSSPSGNFGNPDPSGEYLVLAYPGLNEITASLYGYDTVSINNIYIEPGETAIVDITLPCKLGLISGFITNINSGAPIEGATVNVVGTELEVTTGADGLYELFLEPGFYNIAFDAPFFLPDTISNITLQSETTLSLDVQLTESDGTILIIDLDPTPNPELAPVIADYLPGYQVEYVNDINAYQLNEEVKAIFLLLGIFSNNYVLTEDEATIITAWLDTYGGNIYMEGGDTWAYDAPTSLHSYFNINGVSDGSADLNEVLGVNSYWLSLVWIYIGENNYIDHIEAIPPAINIVQNLFEGYYTGVAYDGGTYKAVGASHEITGLDDDNDSFDMAIASLIAFFELYTFPGYGSLEGYVTNGLTGEPIEGLGVDFGMYSATTGSDGYFLFTDILAGTWDFFVGGGGYCPFDTTITIYPNQTTSIDVELYPATIEVDPDTIEVVLEPYAFTTESVTLDNPSICNIDWSVSAEFYSEELFDLQFQYPCVIGGGEAGIETDGSYLYTTMWNGPGINKYDLDGTFIETLNVGYAIRDLAYDGTYFYGGSASPTVYEMDFDNQTVISSFLAPTEVRAIAYNHDDDTFYANNWGSDITKFDKSGANLGSFPVGPIGDSYYGFAYDDIVTSPCLWGYAQVGSSQNVIIQMDLPAGDETGVYEDIGAYFSISSDALAGGLFTHYDLFPGSWTIGGLVQNEWLWGLTTNQPPWLFYSPASGTIAPGASEDLSIYIEAFLPSGTYEADLIFTTSYDIEPQYVHVILTIEELFPAPNNLSGYVECTDICLNWDPPTTGSPLYYNIYRDGDLITNFTGIEFCDQNLDPETEYCYQVSAVYGSGESEPTDELCITVSMPENLEPQNAHCTHYYNGNWIYWDEAEGCLAPDGYNIYRDGELLNEEPEPGFFYFDPIYEPNIYEYEVSAVYYFGESEKVLADCITGISEIAKQILSIYPIPTKDWMVIRSLENMDEIEIFNNFGEKILTKKDANSEILIDMSGAKPGIYFIRVKAAEKIINRKIVKQ